MTSATTAPIRKKIIAAVVTSIALSSYVMLRSLSPEWTHSTGNAPGNPFPSQSDNTVMRRRKHRGPAKYLLARTMKSRAFWCLQFPLLPVTVSRSPSSRFQARPHPRAFNADRCDRRQLKRSELAPVRRLAKPRRIPSARTRWYRSAENLVPTAGRRTRLDT